MKTIVIAGGIIIAILAVLYFVMDVEEVATPLTTETPTSTEEVITDENGRIANPDTETNTPTPPGKLKVGNFTGTLEEVNTGCFADGECYVVVDGKHITVLMGWSRDTVGNIIGVPSIGDLESKIGTDVEVYAKDNSDGTYTLYGSEGFYVKVPEKKGDAPVASAGGCMVGGCSGQLCGEASDPLASTCEYKEEYACYQSATCERQASGQCGWTQTSELNACLANAQ